MNVFIFEMNNYTSIMVIYIFTIALNFIFQKSNSSQEISLYLCNCLLLMFIIIPMQFINVYVYFFTLFI